MGSGVTIRSVALIAFETLLIVAAVVVSAWIRLGRGVWSLFTFEGSLKVFLIAVVCQLCLYLGDLYDLRSIKDRRDLFVRAVRALALTSFVLAGVYYWLPSLMIGRGVFVLASFLVITVVTGWRLAFEWLSRSLGPRERLLLVGVNAAAIGLVRELFDRRHDLGVEIVGFVDADPARVGSPVLNPGVIGTIDEIPAIVRARSVDRVVVSLADARGKLPMDKLLEMRLDGVRFDHLASVYEEVQGKIAVENLRPSWLIFSTGFRKTAALRGLKRAFDLTVASVGVVLALPLMGLIAVALKLSSRGPVFYHQERVGLQGRTFTVHKFRSMRPDAEAVTGAVWASKAGDGRVTPIGGFLRRARLDELPQLWNVLKGDMSMVGPRPERPEFIQRLSSVIPFYGQRHVVRPGITGWAQVQYTYGASVEDAFEKLQYDLYYVKNMSIALDLFILFSTVKTVLLSRGA